jgi:F-type H+-transporting ATPase subunit delta
LKSTTAAIRYARALFSLAKDEHRVSEVRKEVESLAELLAGNDQLREALLTPLHPVEERKAVLAAIADRMSLSPLLRNFCAFLIDQRRLVAYEAIREEFVRLADEDAGLVNAEVISASPLDDRRKDRLRRALSERTGREVRLDVTHDPTLIGGAIAKVGDLVFDGSLRTQLSQLRANLLKGS